MVESFARSKRLVHTHLLLAGTPGHSKVRVRYRDNAAAIACLCPILVFAPCSIRIRYQRLLCSNFSPPKITYPTTSQIEAFLSLHKMRRVSAALYGRRRTPTTVPRRDEERPGPLERFLISEEKSRVDKVVTWRGRAIQ